MQMVRHQNELMEFVGFLIAVLEESLQEDFRDFRNLQDLTALPALCSGKV